MQDNSGRGLLWGVGNHLFVNRLWNNVMETEVSAERSSVESITSFGDIKAPTIAADTYIMDTPIQ